MAKDSTSTKDRQDKSGLFDEEPPPAQGRRWKLAALIIVIVLILGTLAGSLWPRESAKPVADYCGSPATGLIRMDGECIGVTDGSYPLAPELAAEQRHLVDQNNAIRGERSVTVAVFDPLTPDKTSALDIKEIKHQLQGVIAAQKWINEDAAAANNVRIRVVLANIGGHQVHWQPVVEQLHRMQDDPSPLVAAIGMGVSVQSTLDAAKKLSEYKIPAIGAVTTADDLNQTAASSFFRVSPANRDYVEALRPWTTRFSSALLMYDRASDDPQHPDIFTRSLHADFKQAFSSQLELSSLGYHGEVNSKGVLPNRFGRIRDKICTDKIPLVLFAGRSNDLSRFAKALEGRGCASSTPVTVMVGGSDLGGLLEDAALTRANITLIWSAGSDIVAWKSGKGAPPHFGVFLKAYQALYGDGDLADGQAVVGYDALRVVAHGAHIIDTDDTDDAATDPSTRAKSQPLPSGTDVRSALLNTHSLGDIQGAGGDLSYEDRNGLSGDPLGKLVPVLQLGVRVESPPAGVYVTK